MVYRGEVITLSIDQRDDQRWILLGKAFKLALKFIAQYDLNFHTASSASSSLMKSSALCSLRPSRRACFISSNALSSDSFTYACWRSVFLLDSSLVLNTVVDTTPRSNSMALRTCSVVASSFNVTNICVIIVIFLFSGARTVQAECNQVHLNCRGVARTRCLRLQRYKKKSNKPRIRIK